MLELKLQERKIDVRKELTELQQKFLNALFGEAKGNHAKAMRLAGYSENTNPHHILQSVRQEIIERAELEMAANAPKAVMSMGGVLDDPTELGVREKLMASQQILDRVGLSKVEKINVETNKPVGLFVLPAKKEENEPLQ